MQIDYSFIVPVYNRPEEVRELLESMLRLDFFRTFEVVLVEDGSTQTCEELLGEFVNELQISYYNKGNSGPGDSRNYGMARAKGNYFLILDSDVLLPPNYLVAVDRALREDFTDCFGGPDSAHEAFSDLQKAINYAMTSYLTTGGIRGKKQQEGSFEPRSFNMGLSRKAFEATGGFGSIHPGEDPDLVLRLRRLGYQTVLFPEAKVFHKRRVTWERFFQQVYKFGLVRPILSTWHPDSRKLTFWFPSCFILGLVLGFFLGIGGHFWLLYLYVVYFTLLFLHASYENKSIKIGAMAMKASLVQFFGYGLGFCRSTIYIRIMKQDPRKRFPQLFFKNAKDTKGHYQNKVQENQF